MHALPEWMAAAAVRIRRLAVLLPAALLLFGGLGYGQGAVVVKAGQIVKEVTTTTAKGLTKTSKGASKAATKARPVGAVGRVAGASVGLRRVPHALPEEEIVKLAKISREPGGLGVIGKALGEMKLFLKGGDLAVQDAYLRVAVRNGKLTEQMAEEVMRELGGTKGLTGILRKINSPSISQSKGHMRELEIGLSAKKNGYDVLSFGERYADGLKHADTDLDVLLKRGDKKIAIESKNYDGPVPNDMVVADAKSLIAYCKQNPGTVPVFSFSSPPSALAQKMLRKNKVRCCIGTPDELIHMLDILL